MRPARSLVPLSSALAAGLAGCAPTAEPVAPVQGLVTDRGCFSVHQVNGYNEAPDGPGLRDRLYIGVGVRERWLGETFGSCPDLDWSESIAFDTRGQSRLCTGDSATLLVPSSLSGGVDRCTVRVLGRMAE